MTDFKNHEHVAALGSSIDEQFEKFRAAHVACVAASADETETSVIVKATTARLQTIMSLNNVWLIGLNMSYQPYGRRHPRKDWARGRIHEIRRQQRVFPNKAREEVAISDVIHGGDVAISDYHLASHLALSVTKTR